MTPDETRVSDADRDRVVTTLKDRAVDGTLTLEEFSDRIGKALVARTRSDLDLVVRDLPAHAPAPRAHSEQRLFLGVMSGAHARGRWRTGTHVTAVAVMGGCTLDFRGAIIDSPVVTVTAVAVMGGISIIVPEGVEVSLSGFPVMGGKNLNLADVPVVPGTPRIVVHAFPIMGGVDVRSRRESQRGKRERPGAAVAADGAPPLTGPIDGTVTVMFVDVCGFSELTERLGDVATHRVVSAHHARVSDCVGEHGGQVVKTAGDGLMAVFPGAARALRSASAVQRLADEELINDEQLRVHIGVHAGEVVRDGNDLIGQTVNVASRLTDSAGADEILVSALVRELTTGSRDFAFGDPRELELKGIGRRVVYPLSWR